MDWFEERVPNVGKHNWIYNIVCFLLFSRRKKLSYKQIYLLIYELNKKNLGEKEAKELALIRVLDIYKYLHEGNMPEGAEMK